MEIIGIGKGLSIASALSYAGMGIVMCYLTRKGIPVGDTLGMMGTFWALKFFFGKFVNPVFDYDFAGCIVPFLLAAAFCYVGNAAQYEAVSLGTDPRTVSAIVGAGSLVAFFVLQTVIGNAEVSATKVYWAAAITLCVIGYSLDVKPSSLLETAKGAIRAFAAAG
ncbi:MAG: hypothetical protein WCW77_03205 [Patescibacteria group bacterium]